MQRIADREVQDATSDLRGLIDQEIDEHARVLELTRSRIGDSIVSALQILETSVRNGGKVLLFGNGGSAADAQHIAAELVIRYRKDRPAIAAIALTTDTSALTACGNDLGYDALFARQVQALGRAGDAVIGISTSGKSPNVLAGLKEARGMGLRTIGLAGGDGGSMPELCDTMIVVPSRVTARIQEMHIMAGHILCQLLEQRLGYV
jgi:D-sedoheptulose 7-phosphate isomerase